MRSPERPLHILVSAYACSPEHGSEHAVGWGLLEQLARRHQVWAIAEEVKCRESIERHLAQHPDLAKNLHFVFIRKIRRPRLRRVWPPSYYWFYRRWQRHAFEVAAELHREIGFDLVHQFTMVGFREPGYLWRLGIPFVWGPIGGMGAVPWRLLPHLGVGGMSYFLAYNLINWIHEHFLRRPRLAAAVAEGALMVATPTDMKRSSKLWGASGTLVPEVGIAQGSIRPPRSRGAQEALSIVWSGRHVAGKALNLGLRALALLPSDLCWKLTVLGDGPRRKSWMRLAGSLGIADRCNFVGWQDREDAMMHVRAAHAMLITSVRDLTSTVTIEGLSMALPIVCLDHCGFSNAVDESCGIKVGVGNADEVIRGLSSALAKLFDEEVRMRLAVGAAERAVNFTWERKSERIEEIYQAKLAEAARLSNQSSTLAHL